MSEPVCPSCGAKMKITESRLIPGHARGPAGTPDYQDFNWVCVNPDCPSNESDLAKAAGPDGSQ